MVNVVVAPLFLYLAGDYLCVCESMYCEKRPYSKIKSNSDTVCYCVKLPHVNNTHILRSVKEHKGVHKNVLHRETVLLGDDWIKIRHDVSDSSEMLMIIMFCYLLSLSADSYHEISCRGGGSTPSYFYISMQSAANCAYFKYFKTHLCNSRFVKTTVIN